MWQISFSIDSDQVREKGRSDFVGIIRFQAKKDIIKQSEVFGTTQFENEDEMCGIRVAKVWLARSVVEDFFGEKRIGLGSYELLDSGWRPNWGIGSGVVRGMKRLLLLGLNWVFDVIGWWWIELFLW